ncbi:uncharacterized protein LOC144621065 [Crassostrea virginica]
MHHIPRLSEAVYVGMCRYVGSPTEVRIRREVTDTVEEVRKPVMFVRGFYRMLSGSRREGFRLQTSDMDVMLWPSDHKVICDLSQISLYRIPQHTVILMECEDLPPGFARLKMMTPSPNQRVKSSCVPIDDEIYISKVRIRREVMDTTEVVMRPVPIMRGFNKMRSGSRREGFRLETSDVGCILWLPDHKVISDLSQISLYRIPQHTVILMECEDLTLGFVRLKMMTPSADQIVKSSCVPNDEVRIRGEVTDTGEVFCRPVWIMRRLDRMKSGSYREGFRLETSDIDVMLWRPDHKVICDLSQISLYRIPQHTVILMECEDLTPGSAIVGDGCHIVPIGSLPERDNEWRVSFSGAEQKLIYSMNHCQFLCYGLLNVDPNNPLCLCSYFMKTILFWVIQCDSSLHWVPDNLLLCFWTCFKVLISWVYKGECPNFFIPQNNMFRVKVVGQTQVSLFEQLYALYNTGIPCLLRSPTIGRFLNMAILNRMLTFRTDESSLISDVMLDVCLYEEIIILDSLFVKNSEEAVRAVIAFEQLQNSALSLFQTVTMQYFLSALLKNFSCLLSSQAIATNKKWKYSDNKSLYMMKLAVKIGWVSQIIYLAIHYYRNCQYEESLRCLHRAQDKMSKPYAIYQGNVNVEMYRRAMAGVSLSDRVRKCLICDIKLFNEYVYIDELVPEQEANKADGVGVLCIPPLVMLHMLFVLNHHRLGDTVRSQQSLQDLHTLLLYDDGTHVPEHLRDISWQILGICQQTCGDYVGALNSFQLCSIQQFPYNTIQRATMFRMQTMNEHLFQV